ncbi:MAG: hypothetical protein JWN48_2343 [Myxococcaceae bacterium]|nr:hypothetical protein [Myxococcaceae bacterium]
MSGPSRTLGQLSAEQARALFDASLDGELEPGEQRALEEALQRDAELAEDFERQRALRSATAELGKTAPVDLLAGVQHKLRARSGGKFYRDRFSERRSSGRADSLRLLIVLSACLIVAVLLWFAYDAGMLTIER